MKIVNFDSSSTRPVQIKLSTHRGMLSKSTLNVRMQNRIVMKKAPIAPPKNALTYDLKGSLWYLSSKYMRTISTATGSIETRTSKNTFMKSCG